MNKDMIIFCVEQWAIKLYRLDLEMHLTSTDYVSLEENIGQEFADLPESRSVFDSIAVLAVAHQQLLYGHRRLLMEQSCLLCVHWKKNTNME